MGIMSADVNERPTKKRCLNARRSVGGEGETPKSLNSRDPINPK